MTALRLPAASSIPQHPQQPGRAVIDAEWPLEEPDRYNDADELIESDFIDPWDDCLLPDEYDEPVPDPRDFWFDDLDDDC